MTSDITDDWGSRVNDHLQNEGVRNEKYQYRQLNFGSKSEEAGGEFSVFPARNVILEDRIKKLDIEEIRQLPEFLIDLSLLTDNSEICADHFEYWAWTGAVASYAWHFKDIDIDDTALGDLCLLIQLGLLIQRNNEWWKNDAYWNNASYLAVLIDSYVLVTISGYSILEGLLRRKCKELQDDGTVEPGYESIFQTHVTGGRAYLGDGFNLWVEENTSNSTVEQTLRDIDDLDAPLEKSLKQKFKNISVSVSRANGLLHLLKDLRNANAHGEAYTQAIGSTILSLSCLLFWDTLTQSDYEDIKEQLEDKWLSLDREWSGWNYGHFPHGFYPLNQEVWREPEGDEYNLYLSEGQWVVRFGKQTDFNSAKELLETLRQGNGHEYLLPSQLVLLIEEEGQQKRMEISLDETKSLQGLSDDLEQIRDLPEVQLGQARILEIWLSDDREPNSK